MDLIKYRAFIKVIEMGSITKAANALGYSQPGISHMLDSLEKEIGFPILIRKRESITPTEDGKKILEHFYKIVKDYDELQNTIASISGLISGNINIGAYNSLLISRVPHLISEFKKVYSKIEINLYEYSYSDNVQKLCNGDIDIAFMADDVPKGFEFYPLMKDPVIIVMSKNHPFTAYDTIPVKKLNGCDFIIPGAGWDDTYTMMQKYYPFKPNIKHSVASDYAGIAMAAQNLGIYILTELHAEILPESVTYRLLEEKAGKTLGICVKSLKESSPAIKEFIKMAQAKFSTMPYYFNGVQE